MHAGMVGKTAIEALARVPAEVDIASEFQGVLKIEFYEEDAMKRGTALLKKRNYIVYER